MREFLQSKGFPHFLIALCFFFLYNILGESFKIAISPYILYLVWSRNPAYLPALFIHFAPGTTVSFVILGAVFLLSLHSFKVFKRLRVHRLLLITLLPVPYFAFQTFERITTMGLGLLPVLQPLGFYLGLFGFFYGIIVAPKLSRAVIAGVLFALFILPFLEWLPVIDFTIRAYWLSFPLFFGLVGSKILLGKRFYIAPTWIVLGALFVILSFSGLWGLKLTLIFAAAVALFAVYTARKGYHWLLKSIVRPRIIAIGVAIVVILIMGSSENAGSRNTSNIDTKELSYGDWDDFWTLVQFKAFDDRAVIWAGGWATITKHNLIWPPLNPPNLEYESATGVEMDVEFGIHNIGLELMRNYGMVLGGLSGLLFLWMLIIGPGRYLLSAQHNNYLLVLAAACMGSGIVGGMTGQYLLQITFSFMFLSLCGILYASQRKY